MAYKEGNIVQYSPEADPRYISWLFFKTKDIYEFLNYFLNMKEPIDFVKLIEDIIQFRHKDTKVSFFEYYQKKYLLSMPKLFIYGSRDLFLKPFLPFNRKKLERFYTSCGNAEIHYDNYVHSMLDDPNMWRSIAFGVTNKKVNEVIIKFLDKNM